MSKLRVTNMLQVKVGTILCNDKFPDSRWKVTRKTPTHIYVKGMSGGHPTSYPIREFHSNLEYRVILDVTHEYKFRKELATLLGE